MLVADVTGGADGAAVADNTLAMPMMLTLLALLLLLLLLLLLVMMVIHAADAAVTEDADVAAVTEDADVADANDFDAARE